MIWLIVFGAGVAAVLSGLYWRWARRVEADIAEGAAVEWRRLEAQDPALLAGLDQKAFAVVYRRVHFPRYPGYALAALFAFLVSLPASFGLLAGGLWAAEELGLTPAPGAVAQRYLVEGGHMKLITAAPAETAIYYISDLGGFYYFFGILIIWVVIVALFMRRFHARRPGYLREEILRARSKAEEKT